MSYRLLVVEDEASVRIGMEDRLRVAGYDVETVEDGEAALARALRGGLDGIVLDVMLPAVDGVSVCEQLRSLGFNTPILMVTAKSGLEEMLRGFAVGADDYLTKPFEALELLARVRALLNRSQFTIDTKTEQNTVVGNLRVDFRNSVVWNGGQSVGLSTKEQGLLRFLMEHPNQVLSRERIFGAVWRIPPNESSRTVDVHVASLRKKIGDDPARPSRIRTVYGEGYEFVPD